MPDVQVWTARAHRLLAPVIARIGTLHAQGRPCILLVPEQFTLQAERELLDRLHLSGFFTLEVLSPSRFAHRVLAAVGADARAPLSAAGRQMAVSYALEKCEKKLAFYQSSAHRRGFTEKLAALIMDMKRGGLSTDALEAYVGGLPEGMNRAKLTDLLTVYATYEEVLGGRFGDGEDQLNYIARRLPESDVLTGRYLFVYGFDALPEQLSALLCAAAGLCESLTVALLCDAETAPDGVLYQPVRQSVERFALALRERGLTLTVKAMPPEPLAHAPAIDHLDATLFAYPDFKMTGMQNGVFLSQHLSPFEEATLAARQILRLCAEGMEIERIAVLYPEQNGYAFAVNAALTDSGLPFYTDEKLPASSHALARFLLAALRAMASDYNRDDMIAVMKSGYAPLTFEEACALENYARAYGINRKKWLAPFMRGSAELAAQCEMLRKRLMEPLTRARAAIVAARDATASLAAVMGLLTDVSAYERLLKEEEALAAQGLLVRAGQNSQMWQTLLELMDQLHAISEGDRLPLNHLAERFDCGFAAVSLAALPPASHMLHAGVLGHFLSGDMDAVFLLGMNDGALGRETESLLTETERAQAQAATGAFLGMTDESRALFARMDVKRAMTLPSRYLFISYAKTDPAGKALRPLDLLSVLQTRLFDGLPEAPVAEKELPISGMQALTALSGVLRSYADGETERLPPVWQDRLNKLLAAPATAAATVRLLRAADYRIESAALSPAVAKRLFNDRTLSVSRLEEFAACPYKHFIAYGLRPEIVKEWGVEPVDLGVFFHRSLQNFAAIAKNKPNYPNVTPGEAETMADEAVEPLLEELMRGPMGDTPRNLAGFERARRIVRRACATVTKQLSTGAFTLYREEARFGYAEAESLPPIRLTLADGTEVSLHGKIDRIDRYDAAGETYLRVVDYKSSRNTVDAAKTWWGLQLQLMVYLDAAVAGIRGAKPAGAFYFHVSDQLAQIDSDDAAEAEREIVRQLQMKGIVLADEGILRAMDSEDGGAAIGAALVKDGGLRKNARALDMTQMNALLRHTRAQATALAEQLYGGDTSIRPAQTDGGLSCARCDFAAACGFDADARGAQTRELPEMTLEELRARLDAPSDAMESAGLDAVSKP